MNPFSLFTLGTGTLAPKWPVKCSFQPSEWTKNAGAQGNRKCLYFDRMTLNRRRNSEVYPIVKTKISLA
jgi:hypothetical protein